MPRATNWATTVRVSIIAGLIGAAVLTRIVPWQPGLGALVVLAVPSLVTYLRGVK